MKQIISCKIDKKEFAKRINQDATKWRHAKLKELLEKEKIGELSDMEEYFMKRLGEMHGGNF